MFKGAGKEIILYAIWTDNIAKLPSLYNSVDVGDYVNYPVYYDNVTDANNYITNLYGWRVLSKDVDLDGNVDDIIMYRYDGETVTHRIVEIIDNGFITKGDANEFNDDYVVYKDDIIGKVSIIIPKYGYVVHWLKFKGGKGVASTLGLMLTITPFTGILTALTWLAMAVSFKYSSLSALTALALAPLYAFIWDGQMPALFYLGLAILSFWRHKENIKRLAKGEETKINLKKKKTK